MAIAVVQAPAGSAYSAVTSGTLSITPTAGNTLICLIGMRSTQSVAVTDNKNTGWTAAVQSTDATNSIGAMIWYVKNVAGAATTVTVTPGASTSFNCCVLEVSGLTTSSIVGATDSNTSGASSVSGNQNASSSGLTVSQDCLSVVVFQGSGNLAGTVGSGYTQITGGASNDWWQYQHFGSGATTEHGTMNFGSARQFVAAIALFTNVVASGGGLFRQSLLNGISTGGPFFAGPLGYQDNERSPLWESRCRVATLPALLSPRTGRILNPQRSSERLLHWRNYL